MHFKKKLNKILTINLNLLNLSSLKEQMLTSFLRKLSCNSW